MNEVYMTVSPLLRGVTFDGKRGHFVLYEDAPAAVGFVIKPENREKVLTGLSYSGKTEICGCTPLYLEKTDDAEQMEKQVVDKTRDYVKQYGCFPHIVILENTGVFAIADNYQDAEAVMDGVSGGTITPPKLSEGSESGDEDPPTLREQSIREQSVRERSLRGQSVLERADVVRNKIAVVTGGVQGFGEALVRELIAAGSFVFIADINEEGARKRADELNSQYGKTVALPVMVNIAEEDTVKAMARDVVRQAGGVDLFIANAGVLRAGSVKTLSFADFEFVTKVNYMGYFLCTKHVSPVMALQNSPSGEYFTDIIQINSKSGLVGSNKNSAYAGSKFGGIGLTQSFAMELVEDNIKVNSICPGNYFEGPLWSDPENGLFVQYFNTGKVPGAKSVADVKKYYESKVLMGRGCNGKDVIKAVYYIIEQKYETGQAVPVTGGQVMIR